MQVSPTTFEDQLKGEIPVAFRDFSFAFDDPSSPVLSGINFQFQSGTCYNLAGSTGSGKSTLAKAVKNLLDKGKSSGEVVFQDPGRAEDSVGIVLQNPQTQLLCPTISSECAFGLENHGIEPEKIPSKVRHILAATGLELPLDTSVSHLSMGQQYRLVLASILVLEPRFLILDEPSAQLDSQGLSGLADLLSVLKSKGAGILIIDNRPGDLARFIDRYLVLENGRIHPAGLQSIFNFQEAEQRPLIPLTSKDPVVELKNISFRYPEGGILWQSVSLKLYPGQAAWFTGPNGIGKSTLLRCILGFIRPVTGAVRIKGNSPDTVQYFGTAGYLFQNPQRQIFENTVFEEISFSLVRAGWTGNHIRSRIDHLLELADIPHLKDMSPFRLSYGQQHLVTLCSILAPAPELLLMDDPFAGLDPGMEQKVKSLLYNLLSEQKTAIIGVGHHPAQDAPCWAGEHYHYEKETFVRQ